MNLKEKFFKNGFISPLNILSEREAKNINHLMGGSYRHSPINGDSRNRNMTPTRP